MADDDDDDVVVAAMQLCVNRMLLWRCCNISEQASSFRVGQALFATKRKTWILQYVAT